MGRAATNKARSSNLPICGPAAWIDTDPGVNFGRRIQWMQTLTEENSASALVVGEPCKCQRIVPQWGQLTAGVQLHADNNPQIKMARWRWRSKFVARIPAKSSGNQG